VKLIGTNPEYADNDDQACDVKDLYIIDRASHGASATILGRCDIYLGQ
jgi:hypothetical protein